MGFEQAFVFTVGLEGVYSNHPLDSGGATKFGITELVARQWGYEGDMRDLSLDTAKQIYKSKYWKRIRLDEIKKEKLQELMFDASVNHGFKPAVLFAQKAYNILNKKEIAVDGIIGSETIGALNSYPYEAPLVFMYLVVRGSYYADIVENRPSQKVFIRGWANRLVSLTKRLISNDDNGGVES